jgi:hypothetical protein
MAATIGFDFLQQTPFDAKELMPNGTPEKHPVSRGHRRQGR